MPDPQMEHAVRLHEARRFAEAANVYRQVLRANPSHFEALYALGMISVQTGQFEEGQRLIGEALKLAPRFADGWCARGVLLVHLGRKEEALACLERAVAIKPDLMEALSGRAGLLTEMGRYDEALAALDRMTQLRPENPVTWNSRGNVLFALQRLDDALASLDKAIALKPDFLEALSNRATILLEAKQLDAALAGFDQLLARKPDHAIGWNNKGNVLIQLKRFEEAIACYDRALAIQPDFSEAKDHRAFALFELRQTSRCPPGYMKSLFDEFASHYDDTMLNKLGYRGHLHVRAIAECVLPRLTPPWRILDLGCGTGLVGEAFRDLAAGGRLDGIDIAPRMVEAARARGIYGDVILGDLETVLAGPGPSYDLIVSADTMIYLGDLVPVFSGVAKRLTPGGYYLFACEAKQGEGWEQTKSNRFRHSEAYLRAEAGRAGLAYLDRIDCVLRHEATEPVPGFAVALQKPATL